jgi:hypothetical protein
MSKKSAKIIEIREMMGETGLIIIKQVGSGPLRELREAFDVIEDRRFEPYVEHLLPDIVMITLLAVMAGANERNETAGFARMKEKRLRGFLGLPHGIPSHGTVQRVMPVTGGGVPYSLRVQFLILRTGILAATARQRRMEKEPAIAGEKEEPKIAATGGKTGRGSRRNKTDRDAAKGTRGRDERIRRTGACACLKWRWKRRRTGYPRRGICRA